MDLFGNISDEIKSADNKSNVLAPLAERMRPQSLDEYAGQKDIIGEGKPLRIMIEKKQPASMIFWGPPGTGKTTLALLIAELSGTEMIKLSAVSSGVKEVREAVKTAEMNLSRKKKKTILFIDEIHRFSKSQQDSLLHSSETGQIILIGATTENPSFEVIAPLLSRSRVFILKDLTKDELLKIINNSLENDVILKELKVTFEDVDILLYLSGGDARKLLNGLELAINLGRKEKELNVHLTVENIKQAFQFNYAKYDKNTEEHYNIISAFIKSIRGSDPDAALYWMGRMISGGEDPKFIARRMIVLASEDIGNADPYALTMAVSAFTAIDFIGMPEGRIVLAQAVTYLAGCPKSNASYMAIGSVMEELDNNPPYDVPLHIRNAPTKLMKELNYGKEYKYAHGYDNHFVEQQYLPDQLKDKIFYYPTDQGEEEKIKDRLKGLWKEKRKDT
ncbi:replication-associated recombination protein A [soil metagenome]